MVSSHATQQSVSRPQGLATFQLEIAKRLRFLKIADYNRTQITVEEIGRMLNGLIVPLEPDHDYEL